MDNQYNINPIIQRHDVRTYTAPLGPDGQPIAMQGPQGDIYTPATVTQYSAFSSNYPHVQILLNNPELMELFGVNAHELVNNPGYSLNIFQNFDTSKIRNAIVMLAQKNRGKAQTLMKDLNNYVGAISRYEGPMGVVNNGQISNMNYTNYTGGTMAQLAVGMSNSLSNTLRPLRLEIERLNNEAKDNGVLAQALGPEIQREMQVLAGVIQDYEKVSENSKKTGEKALEQVRKIGEAPA